MCSMWILIIYVIEAGNRILAVITCAMQRQLCWSAGLVFDSRPFAAKFSLFEIQGQRWLSTIQIQLLCLH